MKSFNLINNSEMEFDQYTTPLWAVCYAYCEEHNMMSALFKSAHDGAFLEFSKTLPVTEGNHSIACGDWVAKTV